LTRIFLLHRSANLFHRCYPRALVCGDVAQALRLDHESHAPLALARALCYDWIVALPVRTFILEQALWPA
jgi:hypothetical protein